MVEWRLPRESALDAWMPMLQRLPQPREACIWLFRRADEGLGNEMHEARQSLEACLSESELAHLSNLRSPIRHAEFLLGRAFLRRIVGAAMGISPRELPLISNARGKPMIDGEALRGNFQRDSQGASPKGVRGLPHFSLSHSGDCFGLALAMDIRLGFDLERIDARRDCAALAKRFYAPLERAGLSTSVHPLESFHCIWVRKESYIKALGEGLGCGLGAFTVSVDPRESPARIHDPVGEGQWWNCNAPAPQGYAAALAAPCGDLKISLMTARPFASSLGSVAQA